MTEKTARKIFPILYAPAPVDFNFRQLNDETFVSIAAPAYSTSSI